MPTLRSSRIAPLGLIIGIGLSIIVYLTQPNIIQTIVYTTYNPLVDPLQLYELAWVMATVDLLLNFSFQFSLILWLGVTIVLALLLRNLNITISTLATAMLLPAGTWLIFSIKYIFLPGFSLGFLVSFIVWQIIIPLGLTLGFATLITLPFMLYKRQNPPITKAPASIQFTCIKCDAVYRSQPLICVQCGEEGSIFEKQRTKS